MATMKDVAKEAGVSTSTVSHVINDTRYVSPELQKKVERAMNELNYSPHAVARSLRSQKTNTVGFIASDITNTFFAKIARGIEEITNKKGHQLIVANTDETPEKEVSQIKGLVSEDRVDGLIIAPTGRSKEAFEELKDTPIVFVDRTVVGIQTDAVLSENFKGALELTTSLIEKGHKRIGIVLGLKDILTSSERYEGYRKAIQDSNIEYDESLVTRGDFKVAGAIHATKKLLSLEDPPTAIFAVNNKTTQGVLKAIKNSKFDWPKDIEVAGFDQLDCLSFLDLPLTTVIQKPREMGKRAAELLYNRIDGVSVEQEARKTIRVNVNVETH